MPNMTPKKKQKGPAKPKAQLTETEEEPVITTTTGFDNSNEARNLRVLRHYFPDVYHVLDHAPMATLYKYGEDEWEKTNTGGVLFVAMLEPRQKQQCRFSLIILSRYNLDQFEIELSSPSRIDLEDNLLVINGKTEDDLTYGVYIFSEPEPSSTAGIPERITHVVKACAEAAENSLLEAAAAPSAHEIDANPQSEAMGRQPSLSDIFAQRREDDAGFALLSHGEPLATSIQPTDLPKPSGSMFQTNPDTEFFRSGPTPVKPSIHSKPQEPQAALGSIPIEELFRSVQHG